LNNLQKTVSTSQAQAFDQSNPINIFTHRLRESEMFAEAQIVDDGRVEWDSPAWIEVDPKGWTKFGRFLDGAAG